MEWTDIRSYYARLYHQAQQEGVTQKAVAERGRLSGQNAISKLLANSRRGPSVATLLGAIDGLGISVVEFFVGVDRGYQAGTPPVGPSIDVSHLEERLARLEAQVAGLLVVASSHVASSSTPSLFTSDGAGALGPPAPESWRPTHGGHSSLPGQGSITTVPSDADVLTAIQAGFDRLRSELQQSGYLDDRHGPSNRTPVSDHPNTAGGRPMHRRRTR